MQPVAAIDRDGERVVGFSVSGGDDADRFEITGAGVLTFKAAPDFEARADADSNNVYELTVTATSGLGDRWVRVSCGCPPLLRRDVAHQYISMS